MMKFAGKHILVLVVVIALLLACVVFLATKPSVARMPWQGMSGLSASEESRLILGSARDGLILPQSVIVVSVDEDRPPLVGTAPPAYVLFFSTDRVRLPGMQDAYDMDYSRAYRDTLLKTVESMISFRVLGMQAAYTSDWDIPGYACSATIIRVSQGDYVLLERLPAK